MSPCPILLPLEEARVLSLWRGGDQLVNWVTGPLRGNRMQIESGHRGDAHKVSAPS